MKVLSVSLILSLLIFSDSKQRSLISSLGCRWSGKAETALEVVHTLHRRHHLRRRLHQRGPIGGGQAGVAQDLQEREPHPRPRVGQQAGPPERVGRFQD